MNRFRTDFLFARPSFLSGFGRVFDLFGVFDSYNESMSTEEADVLAMRSDWAMVGQDIRDAAARFESQVQTNDRQLSLPLR